MAERTRIAQDFVVLNGLGLHARPASLFAKTAGKFSADIQVSKGGVVSDGKSILGLLALAAVKGTALSITVDGEDAVEALDALAELFSDGFGED